MSRSWKKYPVVVQEKKDCRYLNRKLRHDKLAELPKGGTYRKLPCGGYDWSYIWTREQAIQQYQVDKYGWIKRKFPTLELWLNYWEKCTIRK